MQQLDKLGLNLKIDSNGIPFIESVFSPNVKATLRMASEMCLKGDHLEGIKLLTECCKDDKYKRIALINLSNAFLDLQDYEKALEFALQCLSLDPEDVFVHQTICKIYIRLGQIDLAKKHLIFANCVEENNETNETLATELLAYDNNFKEYFVRYNTLKKACLYLGKLPFNYGCISSFNDPNLYQIFGKSSNTIENPVFIFPYQCLEKVGYEFYCYKKKPWQGQDLTNKTILIYSEQGLGDNVWLFGLIKKLKEKYNCKIVLATYYEMQDIAKKLNYIDKVLLPVFDISELSKADYICNIFNLAEFLPLEYEGPYIPEFNHLKLPNTTKKKAIVNWLCNSNLANVKKINMKVFSEKLRANDEYDYYVVQKQGTKDQIENDIRKFNLPIKSSIYLDKLVDLFSYICDSDLVISIDTLHVHAVGSLGRKGIVVLMNNITLPYWGNNVDYVPYYKTIKLSRNIETLEIH